jgi:signal transduction histidine kinase
LSCDPADDESRIHMIDYASTQIRATMDEARQAVWNLRKGEHASTDLISSLRQMGERLSREYGVRLDVRFEGEPFPLGQQATHELMMVAREGFFNSVLHGDPAGISAELDFSEAALKMTIADDGVGFDIAATPQDGHYGLQGLRERVNRLGGSVTIESRPRQGVRLFVLVPRDQLSQPAVPDASERKEHSI